MLNKEKYAKEIIDIAARGGSLGLKNGKPFKCSCLICDECDFNNGDCHEKVAEWANSEYVEPTVDWSKVPVDTPILVRDSDSEEWRHRHFSGIIDGYVCTWASGTTSWSSSSCIVPTYKWNYAKLAESEGER